MSAAPRLYVTADLIDQAVFPIDEGQGKYLIRVMRLGVGAGVRVFNGRDGEWDAKISAIEGRQVRLCALSCRREQDSLRGTDLTLLFAPLKKTQTDFVVEKATELGASHLVPVITERTQTRRVRIDRLAKIALEAAEQTERLDLPEITESLSLTKALDALSPESLLIFCDEAGDETDAPWGGEAGRAGSMVEAICDVPAGSCAILIGPEGGFSAEERAMLRSREGTLAVSLGPRILRAETAVVAALTIWQAFKGDWQS